MKIVCFVSGKGGTGKTTLACNMAYGLADEGKKVLLFDADFGLSNVETVAGIDVPCTVGHIVRDDRPLSDAVTSTKAGFDVIAGGTGFESLVGISAEKSASLLDELGKIGADYDFVLVDAGPGIGSTVLACLAKADELIIVTTPDPTGLTDAYAVVKVANDRHAEMPICFVVNRAANEAHGEKVANGLKSVLGQFLSRDVRFLGSVRDDKTVDVALNNAKLVTIGQPKSGASQDIFDVTYAFLRGEEAGASEELSILDRIKAVFGKGGSGESESDEHDLAA